MKAENKLLIIASSYLEAYHWANKWGLTKQDFIYIRHQYQGLGHAPGTPIALVGRYWLSPAWKTNQDIFKLKYKLEVF